MNRDASGIGQLHPRDLATILGSEEPPAVLDVREDFERALGAIPAGPNVIDIHIPMGQIPGRVDEIRDAVADRALVVYCHHGQRSMVVARWLAARGFAEIANLDGGIDAWSELVDRSVPRY